MAFALLPSWSLDYGLLDSTADELLTSYGWSSVNISWLWFLLPSLLLFRPLTAPKRENRSRHYFDASFALFCAFIAIVSATLEGRGLGYSAIILFISLGMIMKTALTRLEWLGGDSFVIGSLIAVVALIGAFYHLPKYRYFYSDV